uniref:Small ribosomal subunit protein uS4c n=1 Tax=Bulboplastis apyrenoidosa TaxID=1070855 RepID=A0A1Y9TM55_9RHOD|nr:30S ribosomal protein S4 [Bulboplastis apyrenoidosa]ARO90736.1 30S ribosomal protein S4 [Bulboplastis apyrenoidosa]
MSRYRGARVRIIRRLDALPGLSRKTLRRSYRPGQHGQRSRKPSEYAIRLEEKQKLRFNYGLGEKQLLKYIQIAKKTKGSTGLVLLQLIEMRLDNILFRLGMAPTIPAARQLVNHGHICVNGKVVSIASFQCKPKDIISLKSVDKLRKLIENSLSIKGTCPSHLELDKDKLEGKVNNIINRESILLPLNELLVIEFYSRK